MVEIDGLGKVRDVSPQKAGKKSQNLRKTLNRCKNSLTKTWAE